VPEVAHHRQQRPEVQADVEGLVELVVFLQVRPVAEPRDEDQVARRRDREQLGRALDEPQPERLPVGERTRLLAPPHGREQHGEHEGRRDRDRDGRASHARIVRTAAGAPVVHSLVHTPGKAG
jgi:hypothetical protein